MTDRTRYAIVPVEPTKDMLNSGRWAAYKAQDDGVEKSYAAMLAAAPEPDAALVERVADAMFHCAAWSSFWSKEDAKFLARVAIAAIRGEP